MNEQLINTLYASEMSHADGWLLVGKTSRILQASNRALQWLGETPETIGSLYLEDYIKPGTYAQSPKFLGENVGTNHHSWVAYAYEHSEIRPWEDSMPTQFYFFKTGETKTALIWWDVNTIENHKFIICFLDWQEPQIQQPFLWTQLISLPKALSKLSDWIDSLQTSTDKLIIAVLGLIVVLQQCSVLIKPIRQEPPQQHEVPIETSSG